MMEINCGVQIFELEDDPPKWLIDLIKTIDEDFNKRHSYLLRDEEK